MATQRKKTKFDLTSGGVIDKLLLVAVPIMGTQLMQMAYNMADMFWLGRVGSDAVAAAGAGGMYLWLSQAFLMIGRMGSEIGVAQSLGRGDREGAKRYSQNALFLSAVLGLAFGGLLVFGSGPLIAFFNFQEANVAADGAVYLAIVGVGIPFTFVTGAVVGTFTGAGNSRLPFIANAVGLVLNIVLDPVLIFTFGMGISGAAVATVAGQAAVTVIMLVAVKLAKTRPFTKYPFFVKPHGPSVRQIFKWSIPITLESMLFTVLTMLTSRMVTSFGSKAMAAAQVGSQIESLSWLIGGGFGSALTAFSGQNYGAGKWSRIHRGFKVSTLVMGVWGVIVTLILIFFGGALFAIFLPDAESIAIGTRYLRIFAACQLGMCMESVAAGCFKGVGKTVIPSAVSIISNVVLRVPLAFLLSRTSLGVYGVFTGVTISSIVRCLWCFVWYLIEDRRQPRQDAEPCEAAVQG